jgi:hypothetical protein
MSNYAIIISPDDATHEFNVRLQGPGIDPQGRPYVFASPQRCAAFVEAVNFAYQQGLRDGMRRKPDGDRLPFITGATPENMTFRFESRWSRWKRRWLPSI